MLALSPDGRTAYTSNVGAGTVSVVDVATWKVSRLIQAGPMVDGLAWAAAP